MHNHSIIHSHIGHSSSSCSSKNFCDGGLRPLMLTPGCCIRQHHDTGKHCGKTIDHSGKARLSAGSMQASDQAESQLGQLQCVGMRLGHLTTKSWLQGDMKANKHSAHMRSLQWQQL